MPSYIKEAWRYVYNRSEIFKDPTEVPDYYNSATFKAKKTLQSLQVKCQNDWEMGTLCYLKKIIRTSKIYQNSWGMSQVQMWYVLIKLRWDSMRQMVSSEGL